MLHGCSVSVYKELKTMSDGQSMFTSELRQNTVLKVGSEKTIFNTKTAEPTSYTYVIQLN